MERRRRRWWTLGLSLAAILVVAASTLSVLFRLAVDQVPAYRVRLQTMVSQALGHPARIGSMALTWRGFQPSLDLRNIAVLDDGGAVLAHVARLRLGFSLVRLLSADWMPAVADVHGLVLEADVDAAGHWSLRGFGGAGVPGGNADALKQIGRFRLIRLQQGEVLLHDAALGQLPLRIGTPIAELSRRNEGFVLHVALVAPPQFGGQGSLDASIHGDPAQTDSLWGSWNIALSDFGLWPGWRDALRPDVALTVSAARLRLSGRVDRGVFDQASLQLQAQAVVASRGDRVLARLDQPVLEAEARFEDGVWQAQLQKLSLTDAAGAGAQTHGSASYRPSAEGGVLDASLDLLRLDQLAPWTAVFRGLGPGGERLAQLHGSVSGAALHYEAAAGATRFNAGASLGGVGLAADGGQAAFSGLDGSLRVDQDGGHLLLRQAHLQLELPEVFAQPLPVDSLSADLAFAHEPAGWRLRTPHFEWSALGGGGSGDFDLLLPAQAGASPVLRVQADFAAAAVNPLKPFMPRHWGAGTREWLGRALQAGRIASGHLLLQGPLDHYPYVENPDGQWALDIGVADATLAFAPGWPPAQRLQAKLQFRGHGLQIAGTGAIAGIPVERVNAQIADVREGLLRLDGSTRSDAARYYALLRDSPLRRKLAGLLTQTDAGGPAAVDVHLEIPLQQDDPDVSVLGHARFDGADLHIRGLDEPVHQLRGTVEFGDHGLRADALGGRLYDTALSAAIRPEPDSPDGVVLLQFDADADGGLLAAFAPDWLLHRLHGSAHWSGRLPLAGPRSGQLALSSDLRGLASELPPPVAKAADELLPLGITVGGGAGGGLAEGPLRVAVDAGQRMRVALRFVHQGAATPLRGAEIRLGGGAPPRADGDGLFVNGSADELDLAAWLALTAATQDGAGGDALAFGGADLSAQRLAYNSFVLRQAHIVVAPGAGGWSVQMDGPGAQGRAEWSRADGGTLQARLEHLSLEPLRTVVPAGVAPAAPFDPNRAPVVDVSCGALKIGDAELGRLSLRTARIDNGQSLEQLDLAGAQVHANAHGRWVRAQGVSSAGFDFAFGITDVGKVLRAFGYADSLEAKQTDFSGSLTWPQDPDGLDLAQARGKVSLSVRNGTLRQLHPGPGRVLGLLNLYALPRRLSFDFRDVVAKGLGFDTLAGNFALADGQAQTDDMKIVSTSMKMEVRGRIGLAARDYDQKVTVYPDVSTSVAVGATLLGGPIAGGVALLAQEIFNKPFNQLGRFSYHVTGSWDNPQVKGEGNEESPAAPAPAKPAAAPAEDQPGGEQPAEDAPQARRSRAGPNRKPT